MNLPDRLDMRRSALRLQFVPCERTYALKLSKNTQDFEVVCRFMASIESSELYFSS
jgi:hypothetical protein